METVVPFAPYLANSLLEPPVARVSSFIRLLSSWVVELIPFFFMSYWRCSHFELGPIDLIDYLSFLGIHLLRKTSLLARRPLALLYLKLNRSVKNCYRWFHYWISLTLQLSFSDQCQAVFVCCS